MAITVTPNLTLINTADSDTNWSSDSKTTSATDTEFFKEGTGSYGGLCNYYAAKDPASLYNWLKYTPGTNINLEATHIYFIWNTAQVPFIWGGGSGGVRLTLLDDNDNEATWYLADKDSYEGGWVRQVIDTTNYDTAVLQTGSPDLSSVDEIQFHIFLAGESAKAATNTWIDIIRYGDGITIGSGSSTNPGTFAQIEQIDESGSNAYNIINEEEGIYFVQGKLRFGSGNSFPSYFSDAGQTIVFKDTKTSSNLYEMNISGSKTVFELGSKAGTAGVAGCTIRQNDLDVSLGYWRFEAADYPVSAVRLYGCTFTNAAEFNLPKDPGDDSTEVLNCSFIECGTVIPSSCVMQNCSFISCDDRAIRLDSNHQVTDSDFINCPSGIIIYQSGVNIEFDNLQFINCQYDVVNASTGWVSANCTNTCNASTYVNIGGGGCTTKLRNVVNIDIYAFDEDSDLISGAYVSVYSGAIASGVLISSDFPISTTQAAGLARGQYNYSEWGVDIPVEIFVRKSSPGENVRYYPLKTTGLVESDGLTVRTTLIADALVDPTL